MAKILVECPKCKEQLPKNQYSKDYSSRQDKGAWCKSCRKKYQKKYSKIRKAEPVKFSGKKGRFAWYGLTEDDYEEMLALQGGVCAGCGRLPNPDIRLNIDHKHQPEDKKREPFERATHVRGLLCHLCNRVLGILRDNANACYNLGKYLDEPPANIIVKPKIQKVFEKIDIEK